VGAISAIIWAASDDMVRSWPDVMSLNRINFCHCKHLNLTYGIALGLSGLGLGKESPKNTTPTACGLWLWLVACGLVEVWPVNCACRPLRHI